MENIPKDRYNIVCIAFYLMGVGTLMPWNLFINGKYSNDISNHYQIEKRLYNPQFVTVTFVNFSSRQLAV